MDSCFNVSQFRLGYIQVLLYNVLSRQRSVVTWLYVQLVRDNAVLFAVWQAYGGGSYSGLLSGSLLRRVLMHVHVWSTRVSQELCVGFSVKVCQFVEA
jgi:hypothetical protein